MKVYASILIFILVFNSCMERKKNGSCDSTAHVRYRNLNFQFPITGKEKQRFEVYLWRYPT